MHDTSAVADPCAIDPATLSAYGRGGLSWRASIALEAHLARCDDCRRRLEQLVETDQFIELLREARLEQARRPPAATA